ncbi:MAG TPA: SDR family oxidoreductase [Phnomibacter sp.]|nr:SDR family oxidoreductase [Phnomibacter sp.]
MSSILVIGGTSDVGIAVAHVYAAKGFDILLAGRNLENLKVVAADIEIRFGVKTQCYHFDALNTADFETTIQQIEPLPNISFYVVGYLGDNELAITDNKEADAIIQSNYTGAIHIINRLARRYAAAKAGTIVGIGSVAGERGRRSNFIYGSANAGFGVYMNGLRNWLQPHKVHVLLVKPGFIQTKMTAELKLPKLLTAKPIEVAKAIENAVAAGTNTLYVKWFWRYIMLIIKMIPEPIFKKMKL